MASSLWTLLFAAALLGSLVVKFWLASRQMRHVAAHRDAVPPPFAAAVPLAAHQKAADYTLVKSRFGLLTAAVGAAVLLGWTLLGGLDALNVAVRDALQPRFGDMTYQLALLVAFALVAGAIDLPFDWYRTFRIEQRFGFNRMNLKLWVVDGLKGAAVGAVIGLPLAALVLWLMAVAGAWWWLWAWIAMTGYQLILQVLVPVLIAPIYNKFEPLSDEALKARVHALLQRCGFKVKGLFVMDGSRRSAHGNAYFTGLGAVKRVVFLDTLIAKLKPAEVEAVLAHELGHFKRHHVTKLILLMSVMNLAGFALLGWLLGQPWFYGGLGVEPNGAARNDALALLLFLLAMPVFGFFVSPLAAMLSRRHEFEADAYACANASGTDLAAALVKLHEDNASTLTPDPLFVRFYYSHPPAAERLAALRAGAATA